MSLVVVQELFHIEPFPANLGFWLVLAIECPSARIPPVEL